MSFSEDMGQALGKRGITINSVHIPDQDTLTQGLDSLKNWLASIDVETLAAVEEVTGDFPVKKGLADPNVNIAPGLGDLLEEVDRLPASFSISTVVDKCREALNEIVNTQVSNSEKQS